MNRATARLGVTVAWGTAALLAAGCLSPNSITCSDGTVCGPGTGCDVVEHACVPAGQVEACAGLAEAAPCTFGGDGTCRSGVCHPPGCGDGVRNAGEQCDGSDLGGQSCTSLHFQGEDSYYGGLFCSSNCKFNTSNCVGSPGYCGDGVKGPTEQCDGNDLGGATCATSGTYFDPVSNGRLACTASCTFDLSACRLGCGDGVVNGGEDCDGAPPAGKTCVDYGFDRGLLGCSADCKPALEGCGQLGWRTASPSGISGPLMSVWGSAANDVYAVSLAGRYAHWDGTSWSAGYAIPPMFTSRLYGVWGLGAGYIYLAGGVQAAFAPPMPDDPARGPTPFPNPPTLIPADSFTAYVFDRATGTTSLLPLGDEAKGIWGTAANDLYAVGPGGAAHFDGQTWTLELAKDMAGVWGSGPADVFAVGGASVMHANGAAWSEAYHAPDPDQSYLAIWGSGPADVFVVGAGGAVIHWDGTQWSPMVSGTNRRLDAVWGTGPKDVFAVGDAGTMLHWNGARWNAVDAETDRPLHGVWGTSESVLAVGGDSSEATILKWGRTSWRLPFAGDPVPALNAIWENGPDDIFAVGDGGVIVRGSGGAWLEMPSNTTLPLVGVWGSGPGDVYAVGGDGPTGVVCHWDGSAWSPLEVGSAIAAASGVWGSGPDDVYIASPDVVLHFDGHAWAAVPFDAVPTGAPAGSGMWASSPGSGDLFAVLDEALWHMRSGRPEKLGLPVAGPVRGLWVSPGRVDLVGSMGVVQLVLDSVTCAGPELCGDGWDNDCDGLQDAADPDCVGKVAEQCANLIDDDGDGKTDCADPDCASFPSCRGRR